LQILQFSFVDFAIVDIAGLHLFTLAQVLRTEQAKDTVDVHRSVLALRSFT